MKRSILFVTGSDTAVGKTVLSSLLTQHLRQSGLNVAALKPLCSGDRGDALALQSAQDGVLTLDEINPWFFNLPLSPLIAARKTRRRVTQKQVTDHVRLVQKRFPVVLIEGAGGLLSPLGEDFHSRDLIKELRAVPLIVCANRLGAINQVLLVLAALGGRLSGRSEVVLVSPSNPESCHDSNISLLRERLTPNRVHVLPWTNLQRVGSDRGVQRALTAIARNLFPQPLRKAEA